MSDKKFTLFGKKEGGNEPPKSVEKKDVAKRWLMVGGGVVVVAMTLSSMGNKPQQQQQQQDPKNNEKFVEVTPEVTAERTWQASALKDLNDLKKAAEDTKSKQTLLEKQLEEEKRKNEQLREEMNKKNDKKEANNVTPNMPTNSLPNNIVPPPMPKDGTMQNPPVIPANNIKTEIPVPSMPPKGGDSDKSSGSSVAIPKDALVDSGNSSVEGGVATAMAPALNTSAKKEADKANAKATMQKNEYAGYIPHGSAIPVVLLNGLEAGTSSSTQSNPQPVFLRVQDLAQLPGSAKYSLEGCVVMSSAFGDLSSERVYIRTAKLSCIDKNKKLIMVADINGVLMDSDATLGLRGEVQNRQGAKLGKAMLAGFAQGLTGAFGSAQSTITSGINGTVSTITGEDAIKQSGLSGISNATNQLAQFYLKEAQSIFPVISVGSGRTGVLMLTAGSKLEWGKYDSQFITKVTPINN